MCSATQGDKQARAEAKRERRDEGRKRGRGGLGRSRGLFLSCGRPFSSSEMCQAVSRQKKKQPSLSFSLCLTVCFSIFSHNSNQHFHINGRLFSMLAWLAAVKPILLTVMLVFSWFIGGDMFSVSGSSQQHLFVSKP